MISAKEGRGNTVLYTNRMFLDVIVFTGSVGYSGT